MNYIRNTQDFVVVYPSDHVFQEYVDKSHRIFQLQQIAKNENHLYSIKRIRRLFVKRKRNVINYMNNVIANLFRIFQTNHVSKLIVGELSHIHAAPLLVYFKNKEKLNTITQNF
ncbi:MAG: transposase [Promethearchaeota archaeon]